MPNNPNLPPPPVSLRPEDLTPDRAPGELQAENIVAAEEMPGFEHARVYLTLEKKNQSKSKRHKNQDNILADPEHTGLMGVMDGLGGMGNGDIASLVCEQVMPEEYAKALEKAKSLDHDTVAEQLLEAQNRKLRGLPNEDSRRAQAREMIQAVRRADPELATKAHALIGALRETNEAVRDAGGMTTACLGVLHKSPGGKLFAIVANIGDSAAYLRRADGRMMRLTHEDSAYDALVKRGIKINGLPLKDFLETKRDPMTDKISPLQPIPIPMTRETCQALGYTEDEYEGFKKIGKQHFNWNYGELMATVMDSLGGQKPPEPSIEIIELRTGDELMFCTDGVVDKYEDPQTGETDLAELRLDLENGNTPEERLNNLRTLAKFRKTYKHDDDIAIVLARIGK
jgi:serine/threonine protein phosphatase PrpC